MVAYVIIVAAGEDELFQRLKRASGPGVEVILDRRRE
jgi:hypothetical protein